jgi:hypothetical protein
MSTGSLFAFLDSTRKSCIACASGRLQKVQHTADKVKEHRNLHPIILQNKDLHGISSENVVMNNNCVS